MAHCVASDEKFSLAIILMLRRWSANSWTIDRTTSGATPLTHSRLAK